MVHRTHVRAFTLIEILVVVAIIGLLVAILVPSLTRAREQTRMVMCRSNMKQVMSGMLQYALEHRRLPATQTTFYEGFWGSGISTCNNIPPGRTWNGVPWGWSPGLNLTSTSPWYYPRHVPIKGTIYRYVRDAGVYLCPSSRPGVPVDDVKDRAGMTSNGFLDYSMNAFLGWLRLEDLMSFTYVQDYTASVPGSTTPRIYRRDQVVKWSGGASMKVLVEEHPYRHLNSRNADGTPASGFGDGNFNVIDQISIRHSIIRAAGGTVRAQGRSSFAFADGHVESLIYPLGTTADEIFGEMGQPTTGPNKQAFMFRASSNRDCPR